MIAWYFARIRAASAMILIPADEVKAFSYAADGGMLLTRRNLNLADLRFIYRLGDQHAALFVPRSRRPGKPIRSSKLYRQQFFRAIQAPGVSGHRKIAWSPVSPSMGDKSTPGDFIAKPSRMQIHRPPTRCMMALSKISPTIPRKASYLVVARRLPRTVNPADALGASSQPITKSMYDG